MGQAPETARKNGKADARRAIRPTRLRQEIRPGPVLTLRIAFRAPSDGFDSRTARKF